MNNYINKFRQFYISHNCSFYISIAGPFGMGLLHLIVLLFDFNYIVLSYAIISFLLFLARIWQWAIDKYELKISHYMAGAISFMILIIPMGACFILTIVYREKPQYFYNWIIYAYALYGTLKIIFALKNLLSKNKNDYKYVISCIGLVAAMYTIQMLEFHLINYAGKEISYEMYALQFITQDIIMLIIIIIMFIFIRKVIKNKKKLIEE